jgi:hypothetical protein
MLESFRQGVPWSKPQLLELMHNTQEGRLLYVETLSKRLAEAPTLSAQKILTDLGIQYLDAATIVSQLHSGNVVAAHRELTQRLGADLTNIDQTNQQDTIAKQQGIYGWMYQTAMEVAAGFKAAQANPSMQVFLGLGVLAYSWHQKNRMLQGQTAIERMIVEELRTIARQAQSNNGTGGLFMKLGGAPGVVAAAAPLAITLGVELARGVLKPGSQEFNTRSGTLTATISAEVLRFFQKTRARQLREAQILLPSLHAEGAELYDTSRVERDYEGRRGAHTTRYLGVRTSLYAGSNNIASFLVPIAWKPLLDVTELVHFQDTVQRRRVRWSSVVLRRQLTGLPSLPAAQFEGAAPPSTLPLDAGPGSFQHLNDLIKGLDVLPYQADLPITATVKDYRGWVARGVEAMTRVAPTDNT